jgi:hypothetical protein
MPDDVRRGETWRHLLVMIAVVAAVDAVAIATWFLAGLRGRSAVVQLGFAVTWTVATLGVVVVSMRKIRNAGKQ